MDDVGEKAAEESLGAPGLERPDEPLPKRIQLTERQAIGFLSCCLILGIGACIGLTILLTSIHVLGPEDQVLVEGPSGKYVRDGPSTVVLAPERKKVFRQAMRLSQRDYAVVKNTRTGEIRHQSGPGLVFLGAYENVEEVLKVIALQIDEYMRLINQMTGDERVLSGPLTVMPKPLESYPQGVEKAVVLGYDIAVLVKNKSSGMLKLVDTVEGGHYIPRPYEEILETRQATVLTFRQYAVIKSHLTGSLKHTSGPSLIQAGAYEELVEIKDKIVLRKDEYIRLRNKKDGSERVVRGPQALIPEPSEQTLEGKQRATFLDLDTAALVLDRATGQQRLITKRGVFTPSPYEQVLEKRQLIRVLPHEAMVVRSDLGQVNIIGGNGSSTNFFLQPYWKIIEMTWSHFAEDLSNATSSGHEQSVSKVTFTKIDVRSRKMFFRFIIITQDNVRLELVGTIFWKILSVPKMISMTSDPSGDVWHHSRSALMQAVSKSTLANFMLSLNSIVASAFEMQRLDGFYSARGIDLESVEVTGFEVADPATAQMLHDIILETTNRINRLQQQASSDEVRASRLSLDIELERKRAELLIYRATNDRLNAEMKGDVEGLKRLGFAQSFIGGLNKSVPDIDTRIDLYKHLHAIRSQNEMTLDLAAGGKQFLVTPQELGLSLKIEL